VDVYRSERFRWPFILLRTSQACHLSALFRRGHVNITERTSNKTCICIKLLYRSEFDLQTDFVRFSVGCLYLPASVRWILPGARRCSGYRRLGAPLAPLDHRPLGSATGATPLQTARQRHWRHSITDHWGAPLAPLYYRPLGGATGDNPCPRSLASDPTRTVFGSNGGRIWVCKRARTLFHADLRSRPFTAENVTDVTPEGQKSFQGPQLTVAKGTWQGRWPGTVRRLDRWFNQIPRARI